MGAGGAENEASCWGVAAWTFGELHVTFAGAVQELILGDHLQQRRRPRMQSEFISLST